MLVQVVMKKGKSPLGATYLPSSLKITSKPSLVLLHQKCSSPENFKCCISNEWRCLRKQSILQFSLMHGAWFDHIPYSNAAQLPCLTFSLLAVQTFPAGVQPGLKMAFLNIHWNKTHLKSKTATVWRQLATTEILIRWGLWLSSLLSDRPNRPNF